MAQQITTEFVDDIDGTPAIGTTSFSLNGKAYEIDLNDAHVAELAQSLGVFIEHARKTGKVSTAGGNRYSAPMANRRDAWKIRQWASEQGLSVPARGRIPKAIREQYNQQSGNGHADVTAFRPSPTPRDESVAPVFSAE